MRMSILDMPGMCGLAEPNSFAGSCWMMYVYQQVLTYAWLHALRIWPWALSSTHVQRCKIYLPMGENCSAGIAEYSFLCCSWSVVMRSKIQEIGFKKFCTKLRRVVDLHQILAGNVITWLEPLLNLWSMPFQVWKKINLLRLRSNCNIKKYRKKT